MYLAPKVFSTNMLITPQPNNLSSKGLEGYRGGFLAGTLLGFTVK